MHGHAEEVLYLLCFCSEGNQCSGSEGKTSKSELCIGTATALSFLVCVKCAGTAEEVLYLLFLRSEGSGAKQCSDVE